MSTVTHTLLLLTMMSGGDVRMTLSDAASAQDCEASRAAVVSILEKAGRTPLLARCGPHSGLHLTPFVHGTPEKDAVHRYRVQVPAAGNAFKVEALGDQQSCTPAPQADPAVYCTRTAQKPVKP